MEDKNPEALRERIGRYEVIINYHKKNPERVEPNRNQLCKNQENLTKLFGPLPKN